MRDFVGNTLEVGDRVIYIGRTRRYEVSTVLEVLNSYVVIEVPWQPKKYRQEGRQVIKCNKDIREEE